MKFDASLQGIDLEKELRKQGVDMPREDKKASSGGGPNSLLFGDPDEDYKGMSQKDREALTQKMMGNYKTWAKDAPGVEAVEKRG